MTSTHKEKTKVMELCDRVNIEINVAKTKYVNFSFKTFELP